MEEDDAIQVPCPWCEEYLTVRIDTAQPTCNRVETCAACQWPVRVTATCAEGEIVTVDAARG